MTLELPARLFADRLALGLAIAGAVAIEAMLARHPGGPAGPGLAAGAALLLWQWRRLRDRPRAVVAGAAGVALWFHGSPEPVPATGPGARVLGRSVLLHWRSGRRSGTLWLTPADLPREALRALRVCFVAGRASSAR